MRNSLHKNLQQFGLNPQHWRVSFVPSKRNHIMRVQMVHKYEEDFRLSGVCKLTGEKDQVDVEWLEIAVAV